MSDAEIGQMRNGLGLSGNQLERYQTQRSIVIKKQADLVNCSALGSLAIEKGFETTVDKLLKELLKKAAGAVGGALGGAAAISGGIVIGMLLSTEEVGESKEELDEFVKEQEKKKENGGNSSNNKNGSGQNGESSVNSNKKDENNSDHMLGENGTQITSKTTWQKGKTERIDVENPSPGQRPGQIHYHDANNNKFYYDAKNNVFYNQKTGELASKVIQKLLKNRLEKF